MFSLYFYLVFLFNLKLHDGHFQHNLRVINGQEADIEDVPYFTQIVEASSLEICGGALVSNKHVLTVSECISGPASNYYVQLGSEKANMGTIYKLLSIVTHQKLITLLITMNKIGFKSTIKPVKLPRHKQKWESKEVATVSGFGTLNPNGPRSHELHFGQLLLIDYGQCQQKILSNISKDYICAGFESGTLDICDGDLGSPLVVKNFLVGLAVNYFACGKKDTPSVYLQVSPFISWISKYIQPGQLRQDLHERCDQRKFEWSDVTKNYNMSLYIGNCTDAAVTSPVVNHCIPNPISVSVLITSIKCIPSPPANIRHANVNCGFVALDNKIYGIMSIATGAKILPFYSHVKYDIAIIKMSESIEFSGKIMTYNIVPVQQEVNPTTGLLINFVTDPHTKQKTLASIAINILNATVCREFKNLFPFKIFGEMICIIPALDCESFDNSTNLCSEKEGAPIFDNLGSLLGIVIYKDQCHLNKLVAIQVSKFIQIYNEENQI